jgi:hypothetical protein
MGTKSAHGTIARYQARCRCDACRAGWAQYIRDRRHRLGLQKPREDLRFYEGPYEAAPAPKLTPLAKTLLEATVERTGKKASDIFEQLLRDHAREVCFADGCC